MTPPTWESLLETAGPGDLSRLVALRVLIERADPAGEVDRAAWMTGVGEAYRRLPDEGGQETYAPRDLSEGETGRYLDEHILGVLVAQGVLEPGPSPDPEATSGEEGPAGRAALRLSPWATEDALGRRDDLLALVDERIRASRAAAHPAAPATSAAGERGPRTAGGATLLARGLVKVYRKRRVVNDVNLELAQGEIVGLLGPNGAGKTTSFYMMVGLIRPDRGRVFLGGRDLTGVAMYRRARAGLGYLAQEPSIFRRLTVEENVMAILQMMRIPRAERKRRLETLLDELSIKHLRRVRAYALSGGERRRLEITRALVGEPKFMLLDEPFAGVDPIAVHDIQQIVSDLRRRGIGVLISDHNVEQTLDIVDRAYIMYDGGVRVSGTVAELVWNDEVAEIYLGPTLTARMRERYPRPAGDDRADPPGDEVEVAGGDEAVSVTAEPDARRAGEAEPWPGTFEGDGRNPEQDEAE
jgi:lipopolysaccharide export system ATP-binding protein